MFGSSGMDAPNGTPGPCISAPTACPTAARAALLQGVDGVYRRMRAAGFLPDAATFRALLDSIRHWAALDGEQQFVAHTMHCWRAPTAQLVPCC